MKYWFVIVIILPFVKLACSWQQAAEETAKLNGFSWLDRFYDTFYKVFYVFLMTAIFLCTIYNFVKNKFGKKTENNVWSVGSAKETDSYSKVLSLIETPMKDSLVKNDLNSTSAVNLSESENQLRQRLLRTQEEIQSLRNQLTLSMDNKTELESTLAMIDKEKISSEMQLELERVQGVLELEKIKKENLAVKREIQKLFEEKDLAVKEVERLERDVRITHSAVVDTEFLEERLLSVRKEAEVLKQQFSLLAEEKEKASSVLVESPVRPSYQGDVDSGNTSWSTPDFVSEYMSLD